MTINFDGNKPAVGDNYSTAFVPNLTANLQALAAMLDPTYVSSANVPVGGKRFNPSSGQFEQYNGSTWGALTTNYALKTGGETWTGALTFANNIALQWKDGSGTARRVGLVNAGGNTYFGDIDNTMTSGSLYLAGSVSINFQVNASTVATLGSTGVLTAAQFKSTSSEGVRLADSAGYVSGWNSLNTTRSGYLQFNSGSSVILAAENGAQLQFSTAGVVRMLIDTAGNFGFGVSPSGFSGAGNLQLIATSVIGSKGDGLNLCNNAYYASGYKYAATGYASEYTQSNGEHRWLVAPSGTVGGAISFNQAMTLDINGNLLVGTSSSAWATSGRGVVEVNGSSSSIYGLRVAGTQVGSTYHDGTILAINNQASGALNLQTGGTTRQSIAANGSTTFSGGVATTPPASVNSGTAISLDCSKSNVFRVTMTGNVTSGNFALTNLSDGQTVNIFLTQDGTGSRTLALPTAFKWSSSLVGTLSTTAGAVDLLCVTYLAGTGFGYCTLIKGFA